MSTAIPVGVYGRRIPPGYIPIPAATDAFNAFRITMASIDPDAKPQIDEVHKVPRATLKLIRIPIDFEDDEDDEDYDPEDIEAIKARLQEAGALPESGSEDEESNAGPSDPVKSEKVKQAALSKKLKQELEEDEMDLDGSLTNGINGKANGKAKGKAKIELENDSDDSEDIDEEDDDDEPDEFVLCTLDPEKQYQQPLDITVREGEQVYFVVSGTHDVYVTGNYVVFQDDDNEDEEHGMDELDYELGSDQDEDAIDMEDIDDYSEDDELDDLKNPRITELESEDDAPKLIDTGKKGKKRPAESEDDATLDDLISKTNGEVKLSKKEAKKLKKNDGQPTATSSAKDSHKKVDKIERVETPTSDKKKVQFAKNLEMGPTGSANSDSPNPQGKREKSKGDSRVVQGVTVEDKKAGKGRAASKGNRVEMRYIGKLKKDGKVFDANKKGKPFAFKLGAGQVIKGWDIGVAGMTPGSERRITIPANLGYGKTGAPPDIPSNADLVFEIKCISVS